MFSKLFDISNKNMDSLPVEIVLKILQKSDGSTNYKLKYMNRRIFTITKRYMDPSEVKEIWISELTSKVLLYNGCEMELPSHNFLSNNFQGQTLIVPDKIVFTEFLFIPTTVLNSAVNPLFVHYPKLRVVKELNIHGDFSYRRLVFILKKYSVEELGIMGNLLNTPESVDLKELLELDNTPNHISIISRQIYLNQGFMDFIRIKKVDSLKLSGLFAFSDLSILFNEIQDAICNKRPINWIIDVTTNNNVSLVFMSLKQFIEENDKSINNITECDMSDITTRQKLTIHLPEGKVTFFLGGSYMKWKQEPVKLEKTVEPESPVEVQKPVKELKPVEEKTKIETVLKKKFRIVTSIEKSIDSVMSYLRKK